MPETHRSFVFYDPTGKRWQRFRRGLQTAAIFLVILMVLFGLSIWVSPQLPALGLPPVEHLPNITEVPAIIRGERPARGCARLRADIASPPRRATVRRSVSE